MEGGEQPPKSPDCANKHAKKKVGSSDNIMSSHQDLFPPFQRKINECMI